MQKWNGAAQQHQEIGPLRASVRCGKRTEQLAIAL
jgi:hypothetical protein